MAFEIAENVYWVGIKDWELTHFHGHELSTHRGSTYNSFIIKDEKTVLVDGVWTPYREDFLRNIAEVVDPAEIDIVVANHAEVDHAGALSAVLDIAKKAEVICSTKGVGTLTGNYHPNWNFHPVKTGDSINIGKYDLAFVEAPMLHWPDSMFTYVSGPNILMPNDAFGQHYATSGFFNDEVDQNELYYEALKYYVNIVAPYSRQVTRKIDECCGMNLDISMIAPSHGVIWRDNPAQILEKYLEWAAQKPKPRAVVLYDTMWDATGRMAQAIGEGLHDEGVEHKLIHAAVADHNDTQVDIFNARTLICGSPTYNQGILPSLAPVLEEMTGLKFQNKIGAAFGSYGWAGKSVGILNERLSNAGVEIVHDGIDCQWQPDAAVLAQCREFGREMGRLTKADIPE